MLGPHMAHGNILHLVCVMTQACSLTSARMCGLSAACVYEWVTAQPEDGFTALASGPVSFLSSLLILLLSSCFPFSERPWFYELASLTTCKRLPQVPTSLNSCPLKLFCHVLLSECAILFIHPTEQVSG